MSFGEEREHSRTSLTPCLVASPRASACFHVTSPRVSVSNKDTCTWVSSPEPSLFNIFTYMTIDLFFKFFFSRWLVLRLKRWACLWGILTPLCR